MISEINQPVELDIQQISLELNNILKDAFHFTSPTFTPAVEHPADQQTGHLRAGSEVFVPTQYIHQFVDSQLGEFKEYVTYTFLVVWDENFSEHDTDKHWNLRIFKTIHYSKTNFKQSKFDLPKLEGIDHIKNASWIRIEILDDNGELISSKVFQKSNYTI